MDRMHLRAIGALALLCTTGITSPVDADALFDDTFAYADVPALLAGGWTSGNQGVSGSTGTPALANSYFVAGSNPIGSNWLHYDPAMLPPVIPNQTTMRLGNAIMYRDLGTTLTQDWTISANVAIAGYSRSVQIGLADSTGKGYSLLWNAGQPGTFAGNGFFRVVAQSGWSVITPNETNQSGTAFISNAVSSKTPPTAYELPTPVPTEAPFVLAYSPEDTFRGYTEIKLTWSAATNILQVYQDNGFIDEEDTFITSVDLTPFITGLPSIISTSFSRFYVGGGTNTFIDSVKVESSEFTEEENDPGDFDGDGLVDGQDFLLWQRGESTNGLTAGDLLEWQENFGASAAPNAASVPEPSSAAIVAVMFGMLGVSRLRKR